MLFSKFTSVPSFGGNGFSAYPLDQARARVARAEVELEAARAAMRVAARKAGVSLANLFASTDYVPRTTADRWTAAARTEGSEMMARIVSGAIADDPQFRHLAARLRRDGIASQARMSERLAERKAAGTPPAEDFAATVLAEQILAAADRRDRDPSGERPQPTGLAAKILAAGAKAHRKMGED